MTKTTKNTIKSLVSEQFEKGILHVRRTKIVSTQDTYPVYPEMYWNGQILAVEGLPNTSAPRPKIHFCILLNRPDFITSPSIFEHEVVEFYFTDLDEEQIPDNRDLSRIRPIDGDIQGYAYILETQPSLIQMPPASVVHDLKLKEQPEMNPHDSKTFTNGKGGLSFDIKGDLHIVPSDGAEIVVGETLELGNKPLKGVEGVGDNFLVKSNPVNNGKMFGFPLPGMLPLFTAVEKLPNIPEIANMYLQIRKYKDMFEGFQTLSSAIATANEDN
jgi:hypothetical protein